MPTRHRLSLLAPLLTSERQALSRLVIEATDLAGREQVDGAHVRALGSVLHDWYTGCEKVFRRIAVDVDGSAPTSASWHQDLLEQMTVELPDVRPAVIDRALATDLRELLGFRHLFRNVYGFELRWERLVALAARLPAIDDRLGAALATFLDLMSRLDDALG